MNNENLRQIEWHIILAQASALILFAEGKSEEAKAVIHDTAKLYSGLEVKLQEASSSSDDEILKEARKSFAE